MSYPPNSPPPVPEQAPQTPPPVPPYGTPPAAHHQYAPKPDNNMAMLSHLLAIFTSWLGPLIIYLVEKDKNTFTRESAAEALNFQLTVMIATLVLTFVGFPLAFIGIGFLFILAAILISLAALIFTIIAAVETSKGLPYRYPLCIRFVN